MKSLTTTVIGFALVALLAPIGVSAQRGLSVSESSVATNVVDRMPTGVANTFRSNVERVYAWTRIEGANGDTMIHHVCIHQGVESEQEVTQADEWGQAERGTHYHASRHLVL